LDSQLPWNICYCFINTSWSLYIETKRTHMKYQNTFSRNQEKYERTLVNAVEIRTKHLPDKSLYLDTNQFGNCAVKSINGNWILQYI
jgi:hypothetical protein